MIFMISNIDFGFWLFASMLGAIGLSFLISITGFVLVLIDGWDKRKKLSNWRKLLVSTGIINASQPTIVIALMLGGTFFGYGGLDQFLRTNSEWIIPMFMVLPAAIFWLGMPILNAIVFFSLEKKEKHAVGWLATVSSDCCSGSFPLNSGRSFRAVE